MKISVQQEPWDTCVIIWTTPMMFFFSNMSLIALIFILNEQRQYSSQPIALLWNECLCFLLRENKNQKTLDKLSVLQELNF